MRINLIVKMIILSGLGLMFGIALLSIFGIVSARGRYRDQVVGEVARSTAGSQTITGPLLVVAFDEPPTPAEGVNVGPNPRTMRRNEVVLLPETLLVRTSVRVEERYRGIYKVPVYRSTHRVTGVFHVPPRLGLPASRDLAGAEPALLVFGVGDARGMRRPPEVRWNGALASLKPGTGLTWLSNGFSAAAGPLTSEQELRLPFEIDVELVGTDRLALVPVGASSQAVMESNWPHPGFTGGCPMSARWDPRDFARPGCSPATPPAWTTPSASSAREREPRSRVAISGSGSSRPSTCTSSPNGR